MHSHDHTPGTTCGCHIHQAFGALIQPGDHSHVSMPPRGSRPALASGPADRIVTGRIVTMNPLLPVVEAAAVSDGRITALGDLADLQGLKGKDTKVLDLGDQVAYPGFIEPHMHYWASAMFLGWADVSTRDGRSYDEVLHILKHARPIKGWILGTLYDPALIHGMPDLTREDLDKIHPDTPVFVMNASMHWAYVNSAAFRAAGIDENTPQPDGGKFKKRDGKLYGPVGEIAAMKPFLELLPFKKKHELEQALVHINKQAASRGYTHTHDAGTGNFYGADEPRMLYNLREQLSGRVSCAILDQAAEKILDAGIHSGDGDDMARVLHWKFVSDGSNQGFSGYQKQNYLGKDFRGKSNYTMDNLVKRMQLALSHDFPIMLHANGDAAIAQAIDAYEKALDGKSGLELRHRIEHCSFADAHALGRMAEIGLSPSFLIGHVYYWGRTFRDNIMGPEKAAILDSVGTAFEKGLRCSTHSDYTVTDFEPLREIQTAVTRVMRDGGDVLGPDERIPVALAMRLKTIDAAWQVHADNQGFLDVGNLADFTVLERDPQQVDAADIADIGVTRTIVAGNTVYEA